MSKLVKQGVTALDVNPDDVEVIWPGVDTEYFKPSAGRRIEARRALGVPEHGHVIAAIGRMPRYKHHETVIAALSEIRRVTGRAISCSCRH